MYIEPTQLKRFIIDSALVSESEIAEAEEEAKRRVTDLGEVLVTQGKLTDDNLRRIQAYILGIPYVDLKGQKIDYEILSLIPEPVARTHNIVAYKRTPETLEVAMVDADDLRAIDFVKKKVKLKIIPRLTSLESIKSALLQYQKSLKAEFGDILEQEVEELKTVPDLSPEASEEELKKQSEELPVVRVVETLIKHAVIQNASDIHIEPLEQQLLVRYRIDGILHDAMVLPKNLAPAVTARIKVLSNLRLDEKRLPQDGRFKVEVGNESISLRVSVIPTYYGEKIATRLLRENVSGFSLEGIGFHGEALERVHAGIRQKNGFLLTTGPTGSGKTTTLYTMLDILNRPDVNICTIEDPIEYQIQRINQTQVKPEIGYTFANGLRSLLRQDPDIIMVGEIRDNETAALAVNASLTGHLVLSTLHTNSATGSFPRLIDMRVEPFLIVSTVSVVIGQRLVRKLADVKARYTLSEAELESLGRKVDLDRVLQYLKNERVVGEDATWKEVGFYHASPSAETKDGYSGRIGINEVFKVSPAIKEMILAGKTTSDIDVQARKEGMLTIIEDGVFKAVQGLTTIEEVFRVVSE